MGPDEQRARTSLRTPARPFAMADPRVEVILDAPYTEGGVRAKVDVHRPRSAALEDAPVLVQVHGGGWTTGSKEQQGLLLMNRMATRGWVCVAMNYRLAPKHPCPPRSRREECVAWVREHIATTAATRLPRRHRGLRRRPPVRAGRAHPGEAEYQPGRCRHQRAGCVPFYGVYDLAGDDPYTVGLRRFLARRVFPPGATERTSGTPRRSRT